MVDFGPVFWRQEFNEYLLLHGGADGFTVQRIVSSCGCTLIDGADSLVGRAVPAEDVLPLSVSFSTGDVPGPKMAAIQVAGSDGRMHTAEIRAQVLGTWDVSPTKVELPNPWAEGAPKSAIVTVSSADERMEIHAQATADWLTCDVERGLEGAEIVLRADAQRVLSGKCSTWLAISTSDPTVNQRLVEVSVDAHRELVAHPPRVVLRPGDCWTVRFFDEARRNVVLERVETSAKGLRSETVSASVVRICAVEPFEDGETVEVTDSLGRRGIVCVSTLD